MQQAGRPCALRLYDAPRPSELPRSSIVDVSSLAAVTRLRLQLPVCSHLTSLAALGDLVDLQSLNTSYCRRVSNLAPLASMVKLQSLNMASVPCRIWCPSQPW
jgi:hypothetical protein